MEKESEEKYKGLIYEILRKEHAKKSKDKENIVKENKLKDQDNRIRQLEELLEYQKRSKS